MATARISTLVLSIALGLTFGSLVSVAQAAPAKAAPAKVATAGETVKIAFIDPLSGLLGPIGQNQVKTLQFLQEKFNKTNPAGVKFELVTFDNKLSPAETLNAFKSAVDQGIRYITQGDSSGVAMALLDAINKYNERNPGKEVVYLNHSAVDPDLTNSKCSYWQFRFDANTSMKMEAITAFIKGQPDVKKVFLLNQNYSHGHQVAKYAKELLARKRPDIQIVGEELHPIAQVRDFAPYVAKIKASGADTVITGNWGSDLALLIKAANEAGYKGKFFTYYASTTGTPTAMGASGEGRVYQIAYGHPNMGGEMQKWGDEYKARFHDDMYTYSIISIYNMLGQAMANAKSTDPLKVAVALEGLRMKNFNGEVEMRKTDHQLEQTLFMTVWEKTSKKYPYTMEDTGYTLVPVQTYEPYVASTPTSCQMKRPS